MLGFPAAACFAPAAHPGPLLSVSSLQEAECKKEMLDVKFMADTKIADSRRAFELQKAAFSEEVNMKVRGIRQPTAVPWLVRDGIGSSGICQLPPLAYVRRAGGGEPGFLCQCELLAADSSPVCNS